MLTADDVHAVIVTRGDCDLEPILATLIFDNVTIWNNTVAPDLGAYGRYEAIERFVSKQVVYVQDDDCLVDPYHQQLLVENYEPERLVALMPAERIDYTDTVLVGWGSLFDRHLPRQAFARWRQEGHETGSREFLVVGCDFVFPMLTRWVRLNAPHTDLPHAHAPNRTWGSWPNYASVKDWYLREAREIRDRSRHM